MAPAILDQEEKLDDELDVEQDPPEPNAEDDQELDPNEPQLDLDSDQVPSEEDPMDVAILNLWDLAQRRDKFAPRVLKMLTDGVRYHSGIQLAECEDRNGLLYFRNRKYVPKSDRLRLRILQQAHDSVAGGHPGRAKCHELISRVYWWPKYHTVRRFINKCHTCKDPSRPDNDIKDGSVPYLLPREDGETYQWTISALCSRAPSWELLIDTF